MSGLKFRKILVGTGWAISLLLCTVGLTLKTVLSPCRASISSIEGFFCSLDWWLLAENADYYDLVNEWVCLESQICTGVAAGTLL